MTKNRVLVLGAGGMLGHMAVRVLSESCEVFGSTRAKMQDSAALSKFLPADKWVSGVDVLHDDVLETLLAEVQPHFVLNCVGLVKQKMSATTFIESIEINALLPHRLSKVCEKTNSKLIQVSTDCVFTCEEGIKKLDHEPNATDLYGRTKFLGEIPYGSALTLRTSIVGRQLSGAESLFEWILSQNGGVINGYRKALYTGLTTMALSRVIAKVIAQHSGLTGVWQVASPEISKYELVRELIEKLKLNIDLREDTIFECDRRLDGTAFERETGIVVPSWNEMLQEFALDQAAYI
jgi:dTDP-4-dehydrorhamnose reductase